MIQDELLQLIDQAAGESWAELDLTNQYLVELPPEIGRLTTLEKLNLGCDLSRPSECNRLTTLPPEIGQLTSLKYLDLNGNRLTTLPPEIGQLTRLQYLDLGSNCLTILPTEIGQLAELQYFDLSNNQLIDLRGEIGQFTKLQFLDLSLNQLTILTPQIGQLTKLQSLNLWSNRLTDLPSEIGQLTGLQLLDLSSNLLTVLPSEMGQLTSLQSLDLSSNRLAAIPLELGQLTTLQFLDLSSNQLTYLPPEIARLTALQFLDLNGNQLTVLPQQIGRLTALRFLDLGFNRLNALPTGIGRWTALERLNLRYNRLMTLPQQIDRWVALQSLDLSNNLLNNLPPHIAQMTNLLYLNLGGNSLTSLPPEIKRLSALQTLYLGENHLATLPPEIGQLTSLRILSIGPRYGEAPHSERTDIPAGYKAGELTALPPEITRLIHLKTFDLRYNPDFPLPPEILAQVDDAQAIIRTYTDYLAGRPRPLNEIKLVLVGESSVGKTSLVNRLLYDTFNIDSNKTAGIAIHRWGIDCQLSAVSDQEEDELSVTHTYQPTTRVRINIWDFGGQEIMHATHQFFLTRRTLYILVLDSRLSEAENRLDYWLALIHSFGGDSPILIVGNKTDQHALDLDRRGLLVKHPTVCGPILETSCATGMGIAELRTAIAYQIAHMPHVTDPLANTWFEVKAELEAMDDDYIPYSRYVTLCQQRGVDHPDSQRALLGFLHDLGVIIHFPDPALETTNILNPEWVTQGVYRILNTRLPFIEPGLLTWEMLARILDDEPYQEKRMFIVEMMQKFELCYELPDRPHTYLIPDLLSKEEPDTGEWEDALRFEIHYPILPSSILTRLIVRMHRHIKITTENLRLVWRTGVLLAYDSNEALVRADMASNQIMITVRGPVSGRRELLTRIREHLEAVHTTIADLRPAERVPIPSHPEVPPVGYKWLRELERKGISEFLPYDLTDWVNVADLLTGVDVRGSSTGGLSGGILSRLRETLLICEQFESDAALRALFIDARLSPWRNYIPDSTPNRAARVDAIINALIEHRTSGGESVLYLLLYVLAENSDPATARHHDLIALADSMRNAGL